MTEPVSLSYAFRPDPVRLPIAIMGSTVALAHGDYLLVAGLWGALILVAVGLQLFVSVRADAEGVRVQNWIPRRYRWAQIEKVGLTERTYRSRRRFQLTLVDGRVIDVWAASLGGSSGHGFDDVDRFLRGLALVRRQALRIADPPELAPALDAARHGDPGPIDKLLASGDLDAAVYEERLHELADAGELDMELLRKRRRESFGSF